MILTSFSHRINSIGKDLFKDIKMMFTETNKLSPTLV